MTVYMAELRGNTLLDVAVFNADSDSNARAKVIEKWESHIKRYRSFVILTKNPQKYGFSQRMGLGSICDKHGKLWWHDYINGQKQYLYKNGNLTGVSVEEIPY